VGCCSCHLLDVSVQEDDYLVGDCRGIRDSEEMTAREDTTTHCDRPIQAVLIWINQLNGITAGYNKEEGKIVRQSVRRS